ncbi:MAG: hypothetical protein NC131_07855 [Roseburia sp.]|nr:hypothetical protein [Roseburia sp.]
MDNEELNAKFEKSEFKELLKDHKKSTIWDVVLFAIAVLCIIIISFAPCMKISGDKIYTSYAVAIREAYARGELDENATSTSEDKEIAEKRWATTLFMIDMLVDEDNPESVKMGDRLKNGILLDPVAYILLVKSDGEFEKFVEGRAAEFADLKMECSMIDYVQIIFKHSYFGSGSVNTFDGGIFGIMYWLFVPLTYIAFFILEAVGLIFSIIKLCTNRKYTMAMYNKRYIEYKQKGKKIRRGMESLSWIFYAVFIIFYFVGQNKNKFFEDPARVFISGCNISVLFYVLLAVSFVVFILSFINTFRKKNIHYWMCTHA